MKVIKVEKAVSKFQFGDIVKVVGDGQYGEIANGAEGIVVNTINSETDPYTVKVLVTGGDWDYFKTEELQLIRKAYFADGTVSKEELTADNVKEGQKFRVTGDGIFNTGDIITLTYHDGTSYPEFTRDSDGAEGYERLENLERVTEVPATETTVTLELTVAELANITVAYGRTSVNERNEGIRRSGLPEAIPAKEQDELYKQLLKAVEEAK